jgi:hypothetical protein
VLAGLSKRIVPDAQAVSIGNPEEVRTIAEELSA